MMHRGLFSTSIVFVTLIMIECNYFIKVNEKSQKEGYHDF